MNLENQTDLWRQFEDADKERDAQGLEKKKHIEGAPTPVETKNNLPVINTAEEESDVDKPAEEYYGRFNKIAQEKLDASYRKRETPSKRQARPNPGVFDRYK